MPIQYINTGTGANKGDGDTLKRAFWKINQNFQIVSNNVATKDVVGEVISNPARQRGISVTYNDVVQEANFLVNIASPTVLGGVIIGSGITLNPTTGLISVFDGNYDNLTNIPQALGTTDSPTFNNLHVTGSLDIAGETTIINSTVITTDDLTFTLANNSVSAGASNGAGLIVNGPATPASLTYNSDTDSWNLNKALYINGVPATTNSSLGDVVINTNEISTANDGEDLILTANGTGTVVINKLQTLSVSGTIYQGTAYDNIEYSDTILRADADVDSYAQVILQNHSAGSTASMDLVLMNNNGNDDNIGFIDLGINSANYNQPTYNITGPGDGYLFVAGGNLVIGTQSTGSVVKFHVDGTTAGKAGGTLDAVGWHFNRQVEVIYNDPEHLSFNIINTSTGVDSTAQFEAQNDNGSYLRLGINSSQNVSGNIQPNDSYIYSSGIGQTLHIGNNSNINFYANLTTGFQGTPTFVINAVDENAVLDGNFLPHEDTVYDLGSLTRQWRSLYVSSSSIYIGGKDLNINPNNNLTVNGNRVTGSVTFNNGDLSVDATDNRIRLIGPGAVTYSSISLNQESANISVHGNIFPTDVDANTYGVGGPFNHWRGVWVGDDGIQFLDGSSILTGKVHDIIPETDDFYDLGAPDKQWNNLYVSSATIYIGGNSLTVGPADSLLVNGNPITGGGTGNGYTGSNGTAGYVGSAGADGIGYVGSAGADGSNGYVGSQGTGLKPVGTTATSNVLPDPYFGTTGDVYLVADTTSIWVWDGSSWIDNGTVRGTVGYTGSAGLPGEAAAIGYTGSIGYVGSTGADGAGYVGSAGELGYAGSQGQGVTLAGTTSTSSLLPDPYLGNTNDLYIVSDTTSLWSWDGASWIDNGRLTGYTGSAGTGVGNGSLIQSDTAPDPATTSTLWYDTIGGRSYIYFDSNWVDAAPATPGIAIVSVPAASTSTGVVGQIAYDSSYMYVCVGTSTWVRSTIVAGW